MDELLDKGGPLIYLLLGCSILAIAIFVERFLHFHRSRIQVHELLHGLANLIQRGKYSEALYESGRTPGPAARVIHSALRRHDSPRDELRQIVQEAGQLEVPKLEKNLAVLRNIAYVAPLIGLLGTILGLLKTFIAISQSAGSVTPPQIAAGFYESLITSAVGLVVAVPAYTFFAYLMSFAKSLMHDMECAGIEIVNIICDSRNNRPGDAGTKPDIIEFRQAAKKAN